MIIFQIIVFVLKLEPLESMWINENLKSASVYIGCTISDVQQKLSELTRLYNDIQNNIHERNSALEDTLGVSEKFWEDLGLLTASIKEVQDGLHAQEAPGLEPEAIREQQEELEVRRTFLQTFSFFVLWIVHEIQSFINILTEKKHTKNPNTLTITYTLTCTVNTFTFSHIPTHT